MNARAKGFSILELVVAMAVVMLVLFSAINFFAISVNRYKIETRITETGLEGILGLEILRKDLESAGVGLPWNNLTAYTEVASGPAQLLALNDSPTNAPRAIVSIDCAAFTLNHSDYLVIKSARVGTKSAARKWTHLTQGDSKRTWTPDSENLQNSDYVIVLAVGSTPANRRSLVNPGTFYTLYNNTASYVPTDPYFANIIYGIDNVAGGLKRPFNRADYFIADNTLVSIPTRCAPGTGVLVKAVVAHDATGSMPELLPLLDCVADMKVVYGLDNNANGMIESGEWEPSVPAWMTAADLRAELLEVRVSILTQEGQRDASYTYPADIVLVGGRNVDVSTRKNYRWKTYNVAVKPLSVAP